MIFASSPDKVPFFPLLMARSADVIVGQLGIWKPRFHIPSIPGLHVATIHNYGSFRIVSQFYPMDLGYFESLGRKPLIEVRHPPKSATPLYKLLNQKLK
jgi:hypothetical protein